MGSGRHEGSHFVSPVKPKYIPVSPCLYRREPGGTYYGLVKFKQKQKRQSLRTKERSVAELALAELRRKVRAGLPTRNPTFTEAGLEWLASIRGRLKARSANRYRQAVEFVGKALGDSPVDDLDFSAFVDARESSSASTYNKDVMVIRAVMRFCVRKQWATRVPDLKPRRVRSKRPDVPTREQMAGILAHIRQQDCRSQESGRMLELMALSGMRLHEAAEFRWSDVDWLRGEFRVTGGAYGTKNGEARVVPLFPALRAALESFPRKHGKVVLVKNPRKPMLSACKALGYPAFTRHSARHYFITNAIEKGVDFATIAQWVGHRDGGTLVARVYGHLRNEHSQRMALLMV